MLLDASKFVVDLVEILTEVGNLVEFKIEIHGLLSDACTLDTCCVTNHLLNHLLRGECRHFDNALQRRGCCETNDNFRRQFTPSCIFENVV